VQDQGALEAAGAYIHRKKGQFEQYFIERKTRRSKRWMIT